MKQLLRKNMLALAVVALATGFYVAQSHTLKLARRTCERQMKIGPELANAYERYRILSASTLQVYRATIPKSC